MVVGNKIDLEEDRKVPTQRPIRQYKEKFDIDCWEVSAKTGYNVKEVFAELAESTISLDLEIYKMNMNQSQVPFGESEIGASMVEGVDSIINPGGKDGGNNRISKNIPDVII